MAMKRVWVRSIMNNVSITINKPLLARLDETVKRLGTTRSAFSRDAIEKALDALPESQPEKRTRKSPKA